MKIRELQSAVEEFIFAGQAHKAGVFDALYDKPDTAPALARRLKSKERVMRVLLEALVEMKYLKKRDGVYSVSRDIYKRLVDKTGPEYEGDFWQFMLYLINPWRTLSYVLENGTPDKSSYKDFSMEYFIRGMDSPWKKKIAPEIAAMCLELRKNTRVVADIGGAPGTIAREFASRGIRTIIYDLKESNDVMRNELAAVPNIEIRDGDATKTLPEGTCDIAFLGNLCHGQSPEDNARIIKMCYEHLAPGGMVAVFDNLRGEDYRAATLALHMITQSPAGDVYTREEYLRWLKGAGFRNSKVKKLPDKAWKPIVGYK